MATHVGSPTVVQPDVSTVSPAAELEYSSISWRAIFAGTFIALLTYLVLMSLGVAVGGSTLTGLIRGGGSATGLGIGAGIWLILTALVSLFVGSYCASRVSGPISTKVGRIQGAVVTALFFTVMLSQIGAAIGSLGRGVGSVVGSVGGAASDLSQNPQVQDVVNQALGNLKLRSAPNVVAQGLATRLVRGDTEGAKNYLASEAGIPPQEADRRLRKLNQQVQQAVTQAGTTAAQAASIAGWTLFGALVLGTLSSILGGGFGARVNLRTPITRADEKAMRDRRVA